MWLCVYCFQLPLLLNLITQGNVMLYELCHRKERHILVTFSLQAFQEEMKFLQQKASHPSSTQGNNTIFLLILNVLKKMTFNASILVGSRW